MRRGSVLSVCLILLSLFFVAPVFADRVTQDLQALVVERFDSVDGANDVSTYGYRQNHRWIVRGSKFITDGYPKSGLIKTFPEALFPRASENNEYKSLGIQAMFDRMGYNYLELIPVADQDGEDGQPVPEGIPLPGRVKSLDMWFWGSNYRYYVEVHIMDYRGITHQLKLCDLDYTGWRNHTLEIPSYIPQDVQYIPGRRGLQLVKIVIWTNPDEKVVGGAPGGRNSPVKGDTSAVPFYIYLDHIKILTDMFETPFDGSVLTDSAVVQDLWSNTDSK